MTATIKEFAINRGGKTMSYSELDDSPKPSILILLEKIESIEERLLKAEQQVIKTNELLKVAIKGLKNKQPLDIATCLKENDCKACLHEGSCVLIRDERDFAEGFEK
jgi:hypothetical protein